MPLRASAFALLLTTIPAFACSGDDASDADSGLHGDRDAAIPASDAGDAGDGRVVMDAAMPASDAGDAAAERDATAVIDAGPSSCPAGSWPIFSDAECPEGNTCDEPAPGLRCRMGTFTVATCVAAGGEAVEELEDGDLLDEGCPNRWPPLGTIDASEDLPRGGLCCQDLGPCRPQEVLISDECDGSPTMFYFAGTSCVEGCDCTGVDCDDGFASREDCGAAYADCTQCGGFAGDTCAADEYCAYRAGYGGGGCGSGDGQSVCATIPVVCARDDEPVCGCDGRGYRNACEAAMAATGVNRLGCGQ